MTKPKNPAPVVASSMEGFPKKVCEAILRWVCKECDYPYREIRKAEFRNVKKRYGTHELKWFQGWAWGSERRLYISIGTRTDRFPYSVLHGARKDEPVGIVSDRLEVLVFLTGHEVGHLVQHRTRRQILAATGQLPKKRSRREVEHDADYWGLRCLKAFRADRATLEAAWTQKAAAPVKPATAKPKLSVKERNAQKALEKLNEWQAEAERRKKALDAAQKKVKEYAQKVRRYEREGLRAARGRQEDAPAPVSQDHEG
jgi:hypothetical protein